VPARVDDVEQALRGLEVDAGTLEEAARSAAALLACRAAGRARPTARQKLRIQSA
jgi:hypothetical protein